MTFLRRERILEIAAWTLALGAIVLFDASITMDASASLAWTWALLAVVASAMGAILILADEPRRPTPREPAESPQGGGSP